MKKLLIMLGAAVITVVLAVSSYSQNTNELEWLGGIDKKQIATYGDAVNMFVLQIGGKASTFDNNQNTLKAEGISLEGYSESSELTKGMLSKMTARYLKLSRSVMYLIIDSERYAYKACRADGIFSADGSENDKMSGPELIEVFSKISDKRGESK